MGTVLCIITKELSYHTGYGHLMPEAHNCRHAAALINQDCKFHCSTLLLNLNYADSIPNIKFNVALKTHKLHVLIEITEMTSSLGNVGKSSGCTFRQFFKNNCSL